MALFWQFPGKISLLGSLVGSQNTPWCTIASGSQRKIYRHLASHWSHGKVFKLKWNWFLLIWIYVFQNIILPSLGKIVLRFLCFFESSSLLCQSCILIILYTPSSVHIWLLSQIVDVCPFPEFNNHQSQDFTRENYLVSAFQIGYSNCSFTSDLVRSSYYTVQINIILHASTHNKRAGLWQCHDLKVPHNHHIYCSISKTIVNT